MITDVVGHRAAARILDLCYIFIGFTLYSIVMNIAEYLFKGGQFTAWIWLIVILLYEPLTTYYLGGTFGKLSVGIKVIRDDGEKINIVQSFIRAITVHLNTIVLGLTYVIMVVRKDNKGLHDLISKTLVVLKDV